MDTFRWGDCNCGSRADTCPGGPLRPTSTEIRFCGWSGVAILSRTVFRRRAAILMVATALACFGPALRASAAEGGDAASGMAVTVARAKNMCFSDTLPGTGVLVPRSEILVRPEREGLQITQVLVEAGDSVNSGQVLARLAPGEGQQGGTVAVQAPAAGVVIAKAAMIGTTASARAEPLFRIAAKGEMELLAETPVRSLEHLAEDQTAKVEIVGVGELSGKVRLFS